MSTELRITVPAVPPSVNTYTRHSGGRHYKTAETESFEQEMAVACRGKEIYGIRFAVEIDVYFGPKQGRDIDNLPKCVLDGLARNGVLCDLKREPVSDNHVDELRVRKFRNDRSNPRTEVTVRPL